MTDALVKLPGPKREADLLRGEAVVAERRDQEREKALRKYGETALLPAGRPDYDIFDYLLNELVGLERYGEMCAARAELIRDLAVARLGQLDFAEDLFHSIAAFGRMAAARVAAVRLILKDLGYSLGEPEQH